MLLAYFLKTSDDARLWQAFGSMSWALFSIAILIYFPGKLIEAYRWFFILKRLGQPVPFWIIVHYSLLGLLSSMFLPGQVSGDIVKLIAVTRNNANIAVFVLSVAIEKCSVLIGVTVFTLLGVLAVGPISELKVVFALGTILFVFIACLYFMLCVFRKQKPDDEEGKNNNLLDVVTFRCGWLGKLYVLPRLTYGDSVKVFALAMILQLLNTIGSFIILLSLHIEMTFIDWAAINAMVAFVQLLPISIGGLGLREGTLVTIFGMYQISAEHAIALSLIGFTVMVLLTGISWSLLGLAVPRKDSVR
jgi:uncharacterized membrane protein YbhN (UPF0104 family)